MKQINIQITDSEMVQAIDGLADANGYQETIDGKPNPQSKDEFSTIILKTQLSNYLASIYSNWVISGIRKKAIEEARSQFIITVQ